jgi:hypothetical protein
MRSFVRAGIAGALLLVPCLVAALEPCEQGDSCAEIGVNRAEGHPGDNVVLRVNFTQGPDDSVAGEGNDNVAAIAFSIGIPGKGEGQPLRFSNENCLDANGDGLPDGVTIPDATIRDQFRVVIENVDCEGGTCGCGPSRESCLCPGDGQTRQDFINAVVFGPKELPAEGPVDIPALPDSAELLRLSLQIIPGTEKGEIPVHVFAETDPPTQKPQFAANLSIGDQAAIDQTADSGADRSKVRFIDGAVNVLEPLDACPGDCNRDTFVRVSELITGVNIALDKTPVTECMPIDTNGNSVVAIDELVEAVDKSLAGCP